MKRVIALVLLLSGVMTLFAFNVSAENTYVRELRSYSNSISSVSLTYSATAAQFGYVTESTLTGGMISPVLVTVRFTNNGSQDIKIANSYVDLTFTTYSQLAGYDCYTSDLMVQMVKNGNDTPRYNIVASNAFSYGGHIIIPAHSSMYLVFEVDIEASYNTSSGQVTSPALDAVLVNVNASDVVAGNYPTTGSVPEQLDELDTHLQQLAGYQYSSNQNLANLMSQIGDIKNLLILIKDQIVTTHNFSLDKINFNAINTTTGWTQIQELNKDYNLYIYVTKPIPTSTAVAIDGVTGNDLQYNVYRSSVRVMLVFRRTPALHYSTFGLKLNYFGTTPIAVDNVNISSTFAEWYTRSNNGLTLYPVSRYIYADGNVNKQVVPSGLQYVILSYDMYYDSDQSVTLTVPQDLISTFITGTFYEETKYDYIVSDNYLLNLIYSGMQSSSSGSISSNSSTLNNTESQVHQQEQLYFQQNAQAILDTGLSNYRFNTEQSNGISAVSIDFTALWNALGSWNSVYVFTLTLTIALTILRHAPNAISTSRRRNYDNNDRGS